ncbi:MAG: SHOCT domain-containing protein [[Eubacterium] siraeum]
MKENHDELGYFMAQKITEKMLEKGLISLTNTTN